MPEHGTLYIRTLWYFALMDHDIIQQIKALYSELPMVNCRGCGQCVDVCPEQAITLRIEDDYDVEGTIERLESLVDVT